MVLGSVGRAVEVQLRLSPVAKLQPSVVIGRGRVISGMGGDIRDARQKAKAATNPVTRPDKPPYRKSGISSNSKKQTN